jgi:uncharacterized protein (TIGR02996 family)
MVGDGPMTHDEAFMADVRATPADDAPRLIYADWLDEHGQPERAEFIRAQCEAARLDRTDPRRTALVARAWRLRQEHQARWLGPLRRALVEWHFRRGFLEKATLNGQARSAHAAALFRSAPLRHLCLDQPTKGMLEAVLSSPHMARLETLDLSRNQLTDADAEGLSCCPRLAGLQCLRLNFNWISDRGAQLLSYSRPLQGVGRLEMMGNPIWRSGHEYLDGRKYLTHSHGERVVFFCARDEDFLYPIQTARHRNWEAGLAGDCQVLMLGEHERVLGLFFDREGEFLEQQIRPWPRPAQGYRGEFDELWEATCRPWQQELRFEPTTICVKRFAGPEGEPCIIDYAFGHRDFFQRPEELDAEERDSISRFLHEVWLPRGQFVLNWGDDFWMDNTGEVVAT